MATRSQHLVHYVSTGKGVIEQSSGEPAVYFGTVFTVPRDDYIDPKFWNKYMLDTDILVRDVGDMELVPGGLIERYEVYDRHTGDVHVMYRVPFRKKPSPTVN